MELSLTGSFGTPAAAAAHGAVGYGIGTLAGGICGIDSSQCGLVGAITALANFVLNKLVDALGKQVTFFQNNGNACKVFTGLACGAGSVAASFALGLIGPVGIGVMSAAYGTLFLLDAANTFSFKKAAPAS